jgi:Tfp pilus assembly protein PilP
MKKVLTQFFVFFVLFLALEGLGKTVQKEPTIQKIIPVAQKGNPGSGPTLPPPVPISPPEMSVQTAHPYNPTGKPDPFMPTTLSIETSQKGKKVLPLEQFEVNDFELVGIVTGSGIHRAMVQDLTGKGYFIQVGTRIGKVGGKVIRISGKEVVIREPFQDFLGRRNSRVLTLRIPQTSYGIP